MGQGSSRRAPFDDPGQLPATINSVEESRPPAEANSSAAPGLTATTHAISGRQPSQGASGQGAQGATTMAAVAAAPVSAAPAAARPAVPAHKSTAIIPGWSKQMSSTTMSIECQKISQPARGSSAKECYGVMEVEVMKFVAYCGGLTIRMRVDELMHGPVDTLTWGLAALRACPALSSQITCSASPVLSVPSPSSPERSRTPGGSRGCDSPRGGAIAFNKANPAIALPLENAARKSMYGVCAAATFGRPNKGDIITMDLCPKEDGQPVIVVTFSHNSTVVMKAALPCASIAALQMYPYVTVHSGMVVSLHEALTPSPLFTWYSPSSATADIQMADLDTCVKYNTQAAANPNAVSEFHGSTIFGSGRHRWTVQLDNNGPTPGYIFVGLVNNEPCASPSSSIMAATLPAALAGRAVTAATIPTPTTPTAAAGGMPSLAGLAGGLTPTTGGTPGSPMLSLAMPMITPLAPPVTPAPLTVTRHRWGVWVKMPAAPGAAGSAALLGVPPRDGTVQVVESNSNHCCITVDLDLVNGTAKFFRNGHLLGSALTGLVSPITPALAFLQGMNHHLQAGLVNVTKLRQLDLEWDPEACSGDLRISQRNITKVSEVFGDYSTVLCNHGFISGVHLWLVKVVNLSEPDSIFIGVCRGCMPLDQDPQDLRDRTYYLSNGVIRVGGRRVATNAANFTKGDIVGVVLDADQGEIVFLRNGIEQGRARGIRGRLYPFVSFDSEGDQIALLGSYTLPLDRTPRNLADMEWDTLSRSPDLELSSNCLTATKSNSQSTSTVRGTILYSDRGVHEFHVILDNLGPDGIWVGVGHPNMDCSKCVGDVGCGWALHSDGDRRFNGREEEFTSAFQNGDVLTVGMDLGRGVLRFARNGVPLGEAFGLVVGPLVAVVTLASEESRVTIQNRPTVLNMGEYTGELRWDEVRAGRDLHVIDGLTVTKMSNEGGDYATVLGTLCVASGQHSWNVYINHVEDSNLFIGVTMGGHDLNADPQEMKSRTYYLSNGTIRVAGKLVTRCAEPYAEGDLVSVQLDMEQRHIGFLKNGVLQGAGDGLPEEVWPYVSLDNIMDSITLHSSHMFMDLAHSLKWKPTQCSPHIVVTNDGATASLRASHMQLEAFSGQATALGLREYTRTEVHSWVVRIEQASGSAPSNFLVGVAPPTMDLAHSIGEEGCGIGLDYYGYIYVSGRYFHVSNLHNWQHVAKPVRGSTARHKGKAGPMFQFYEGQVEITLTLDLKEGTLRFSSGGHSLGTIANVKGPLHAALTLTSSRQTATLAAGPIGKAEHTAEELVNILKAKGHLMNTCAEAAMLLVPRDLFVPRDRHREAFRDQKVTVRMADGSTLTMPPPSFVVMALERLDPRPGTAFLDVGCGSGFVTALAAIMVGSSGIVHGIECVSSRLEGGRSNMRMLRERLPPPALSKLPTADAHTALSRVVLSLSNVLIPECTEGQVYDAIYCDTTLSEEDLPAFLALLKPQGRMAVVIEEELLLIVRSGNDVHDFHREVITKIQGEFGELEDPTPWEVQEAIQRIKLREHSKGLVQAKGEVGSLRSSEVVDLQQRMCAAMQRIADLELALTRSGGHARARPAGMDDTRAVIRDARSRRTPRMSPRGNPRSPGADATLYGSQAGGVGENAKLRMRQLMEGTQDGAGPLIKAGTGSLPPSDSSERAAAAGLCKAGAAASPSGSAGDARGDALLQALSMQALTPAQVAALVAGAPARRVCSYEVYSAQLKGTPVHVWRLSIPQPVSPAELHRVLSRFCVSHPTVCAMLGACLEPLDTAEPMEEDGTPSTAGEGAAFCSSYDTLEGGAHLWLVEERHSDKSLAARIECGLISWQAVLAMALDMGQALAYLQELRRLAPAADDLALLDGWHALCAPLSPLAVAQMLAPAAIQVAASSTKLSLAPALLAQLEFTLGVTSDPARVAEVNAALLPYIHPSCMFGSGAHGAEPGSAFNGLYGYGVVLLQLLTEQQAPGLLGLVSSALEAKNLLNYVPRTPAAGAESAALCEEFARLALRCTSGQGASSSGSNGGTANSTGAGAGTVPVRLDGDLLPALEALQRRLRALGPAAMSWEQVEELMMMPLQPRAGGADGSARRWVRQDFRMRRKLFLEELAKLAVEGPIHKIEVRRSRCFKDSVATFAGKGQNVWRQPIKITFIGEAGMDSGGVTREWFSSICSALARGSLELFWTCGPSRNDLFVNPTSNSPSHLKRFHFVGMFMAKALLETAARGKELGALVLNLRFCEPFWKLLLGVPLSLMDLQVLDPAEFRSLMQILEIDIDGLIFETFTWNFQHVKRIGGTKDEPEIPALPAPASGASPFSGDASNSIDACVALKPGGSHIKVTNSNKREYVLLKAHKMLMGAVETQMSALIDAFHSLVPRELLEKYAFTSLEMQLLVCGEQRIDLADLRTYTKYEDGYTGKEEQIAWFWAAVASLDDQHQRMLLQFWSGSDGQPAEGFGSVEPAFHIIAVERMYDVKDRTARLPAAHTCFRQLDLPRYRSYEELREKVITAITVGQGYMALS